MRRPNRTHAELRIPDGAGDIVTANRGLIGTALRLYFPWVTSRFRQLREDLEAVALFSLAKAARDHDPARAKYSTLATTYIVNDLKNEIAKQQRAGRFRPVDSFVVTDKALSPHMEAVMAEAMYRAWTPGMFEESDDEQD